MGVWRFLCIVVAILFGSDFALASSVTILFTHDLHSNFKPAPQKAGGFAALAAAIQAQRQTSPANVLVLDAGDFSMGNLFHTLFTSEAAELRLMGELGIDATTLGNHDFDFRPRKLAEMLIRAKSVGADANLTRWVNLTSATTMGDVRCLHHVGLTIAKKNLDSVPYALTNRSGLRAPLFVALGEVRLTALKFADSTGLNLLLSPAAVPLDFPLPDPVMRATGQLPIAHGWTQAWTLGGFF